jgi:hypothetical protein
VTLLNERGRGSRERLNARSPLCRLPTELLAEIFRILHRGSQVPPEACLQGELVYDECWTPLMLTCTHLRRIALLLWTLIDYRMPFEWVIMRF